MLNRRYMKGGRLYGGGETGAADWTDKPDVVLRENIFYHALVFVTHFHLILFLKFSFHLLPFFSRNPLPNPPPHSSPGIQFPSASPVLSSPQVTAIYRPDAPSCEKPRNACGCGKRIQGGLEASLRLLAGVKQKGRKTRVRYVITNHISPWPQRAKPSRLWVMWPGLPWFSFLFALLQLTAVTRLQLPLCPGSEASAQPQKCLHCTIL